MRNKKILYLHSNTGELTKRYHVNRVTLWKQLGYDVTLFDSTRHLDLTLFPSLDRMWRRRDPILMAFYEALCQELVRCDIFIHFNGANIHPEYLDQFSCIKVYHCADDPDSSNVLSRPVAPHYDICAISNIACLDLYRQWGCKKVFFWPLGSIFPDEVIERILGEAPTRTAPVVFVGSKYGVSSIPLLGRLLGLYKRRSFMSALERRVSCLVAYGPQWKNGFLPDDQLPRLYASAILGVNKHNSTGPINFRLYDLPAFGVLQICDCKDNLASVYRLNEEVVGYDSLNECVDAIGYYLSHPEEAGRIAAQGRERFKRDYSSIPLWKTFVANLERCLAPGQS